MKAIATADLHIDINNRFEDTKSVLRQIASYAIKNKIDQVYILGDIFERKRPYNSEKVLFSKFIKSLTDNLIQVILISGNHDIDKHQVSALAEYGILNIPRVSLLPNPSVIETRCSKIYLGHFLVVGAKLGVLDYSSKHEINLEEILKTPANLYLLGDVHKPQKLHSNPDVLYVGSPERIDFGERDEVKGFTLIEDSTSGIKYHFINLKTRPMIQFDLTAKECESICFTGTEEAIVKIKITCTKEEYKTIDEKAIREALGKTYSINIMYDILREDRVRNANISEGSTPEAAFISYAYEIELDTKTTDLGLKIIREAE